MIPKLLVSNLNFYNLLVLFMVESDIFSPTSDCKQHNNLNQCTTRNYRKI